MSEVEDMLRELEEAKVKAGQLMSPSKWQEFFTRLEGPEGCDFQEEPEWSWKCAGGTDQTLAKAILGKMGLDKDEVNGVLECVSSLGGHCDCEILFNAAARIDP